MLVPTLLYHMTPLRRVNEQSVHDPKIDFTITIGVATMYRPVRQVPH